MFASLVVAFRIANVCLTTKKCQTENIEVEELRKLTKEDLAEFYQKMISDESKQRRKLAVYIYPPEMNTELTKETLKVSANQT